MMRAARTLALLAAATTAAVLTVAAPASGTATTPVRTGVLTTFDMAGYGVFAESMASDGHGGLVVNVTTWNTDNDGNGTNNTAQLWRVRPDGSKTAWGGPIDIGPYGMSCGVALDEAGNAYVAAGTFDVAPVTTVVRMTPSGRQSPWITMPGLWPNGVTVSGRRIFVTDSFSGDVYLGSTKAPSTVTTPWASSELLAPAFDPADPEMPGIGANGVAVRDGSLYVTGWNQGTIVRFPIRHDGSAGPASLVVQDQRLVEADGIAFDQHGTLWVAVNRGDGSLVSVSPKGRVSVVDLAYPWVDYPTQPVVQGSTVFLLDGSLFMSAPKVVVLRGLA
jgi:sugar lactone lactonase YvrE